MASHSYLLLILMLCCEMHIKLWIKHFRNTSWLFLLYINMICQIIFRNIPIKCLLVWVYIFSTNFQTTNFSSRPNPKYLRTKNKYYLNDDFHVWQGRKYCRKQGKFWLPVLSPFCTVFSSLDQAQKFPFNSLPNDKIFLPNDKISDQSKLKAFAEDKLKVIQMAKFVLDKIENIVRKEEMLVTSIFFFSHNVFKRLFLR